ncbi:AP endonuclease, partial [Rhizobium ruizarguesonis]
MTITITTAPCCWGVDDVNNPNHPGPSLVVETRRTIG